MNYFLPAWCRQEIPDASVFEKTQLLRAEGVNTVCLHAHCPNVGRCFRDNAITFLILGRLCTRGCRFCAVEKSRKELPVDEHEPQRIAEAAGKLGLRHAVITSVTRDDLDDGGARLFARTIRALKGGSELMFVEVLIPDFCGRTASIAEVTSARPDVIAHNIETVERLYAAVRPQAGYWRSLEVLRIAKAINPAMITKSSLMVGLGEAEDEVIACMRDLRAVDCDILTIGQYLAPSRQHYPVQEFINPLQFSRYERIGIQLGFKALACGPLIRSSFRAQELFERASLAFNTQYARRMTHDEYA